MIFDRIKVKHRLCFSHLFLLASLFIAVGVGVFHFVKHSLEKNADSTLYAISKSILENRVSQINSPIDFFLEGFRQPEPYSHSDFFSLNLEGRYAQIISVKGDVYSRSGGLNIHIPMTSNSLTRAERGLATFETFKVTGTPTLRQITMPIMMGGMFIGQIVQVGVSVEPIKELMNGVSLVLWTVLPIGGLLAAAMGYLLASQTLRPVQIMTRVASTLGIHNLSGRIPVPVARDEIRDLALTFNDMIVRIEDSVLKLRRFTGDVSHELRTPLAVIRGEAEYALRKPRSEEDYKKILEVIKSESVVMSRIVEELLLLARVEGRAVQMNWGRISIEAFFAQLMSEIKPIASPKNVRIIRQIKPGFVDFEASEGYLSLAVKNILLNAVKHSPENGEVGIDIDECFSKVDRGYIVCITIKDQGEGIAEKDLPYIFDPFYRVDSARNRAIGGSGIGLSLAMALVKLHGGRVEVSSNLGIGSSFRVIIPQGGFPGSKEDGVKNKGQKLSDITGSEPKKAGETGHSLEFKTT